MTANQPGPQPTDLQRTPDRGLRIVWSDGQTTEHTARSLRDACPCATCREKKQAATPPPTQLTVLAPEETAPVDIAGMRPVGAYAYGVRFTDGHSSGLFTFQLLRELGGLG